MSSELYYKKLLSFDINNGYQAGNKEWTMGPRVGANSSKSGPDIPQM